MTAGSQDNRLKDLSTQLGKLHDTPPAEQSFPQQGLSNTIAHEPWAGLREKIPNTLIDSLSSYTIPLATEASKHLEKNLDFYAALPAAQRSEIQFIVQVAIAQFTKWANGPFDHRNLMQHFTNPKGTLLRSLSMQQTVELTRGALEFFEQGVTLLASTDEQVSALRELVLRYGWEIGFTTASAYAKVAESRGSLDSRMEAALVDGIVRGIPSSSLLSLASALNINAEETFTTLVIGTSNESATALHHRNSIRSIQRIAQQNDITLLTGLHGKHLILIVLGGWQKSKLIHNLMRQLPDSSIVIGPSASGLSSAHCSAREALVAHAALPGWTQAPCPVFSDELLPERAIVGDITARKELISKYIIPIKEAGAVYWDTLIKFLDTTSVEATAADMFVHQNTIRYRLKKIAELSGLDVFNNRDAFTLRLTLTVSHLPEGLTFTPPGNADILNVY